MDIHVSQLAKTLALNDAQCSTGICAHHAMHADAEVRRQRHQAQGLRSAYLGMGVEELDGRALVADLDLAGPAARAGIVGGDRVVAIAGAAIGSRVDFTRAVLAARPGRALEIDLERAGRPLACAPIPLSHTAWTVYRQCGLELEAVDYRTETDLVRSASVDLYRAFTGDRDGSPRELMAGALRVVRVDPAARDRGLAAEPGDLLLGIHSTERGLDIERTALRRLEGLSEAGEAFAALATLEGGTAQCWLWRAGEVLTVNVPVKRPR